MTGLIMRLAGLILVICAFVAPAAGAATVGGFDGGDGDQLSADCSAVLDWQCLPAGTYAAAIDNQDADDGFASSKEDDLDHWSIVSGVSSPSKADIQAAWSHSYTSADRTTNYLDIAFKRVAAGGDTFLGFELNQSGAAYVNSAGTTVPCRTTGDVLVSYEISSTSASVRLYRWVAGAGSTTCAKGATGHFTGPFGLAAAALALNDGRTVQNFLSTASVGTSFPSGQFGEGAIDLRALADAVAPGAGSACEYFRRIQVTTRSSSSINSSLEDYLFGGSIAARACATDSPNPSVIPVITSPADNSDNTTGTITLTGTGEPNTTLTIEDGNTVVGLADVDSAGNWSLTLTGVADGTHPYTAVAGPGVASNTVRVNVKLGGKPKPPGTTTTEETGGTPGVGTTAGGPGQGIIGLGLFGPGPKCVLSRFRSYVKLPGARRVVFIINGRTYATVRKADKQGRFSALIDPARLTAGKHTIKAKVYFKAPHKPRVLRLKFKKCNDKCVSRRSFRIRLSRPRGQTISRATVYVNGKRVKVVRGRRLTAPVRLTGLPKGTFRVRIRIVTNRGRVVTTTRTYHTCRARKK